MSSSTDTRSLVTLLGLGCVWGASFLFIKVVVDETEPLELVLGRLFFGALTISLFMLATRHRLVVTRRLLVQMSVMAIFSNVIPFGLIAWGEEHIESGTASLLNATVPIFTAVIAAAFLPDEHFTVGRAVGLLLAFLGVGVLTAEGSLDVTDSNVLGQLAVVLAAVCYGCGAVYARTLLRGNDAVNLSVLQTSLGTLYTIPILLLVSGAPNYDLSAEAWASMFVLGVLGTGLGYIAWLWLIDSIGSVRASLVTYIVPIVAVVLGWLVLDESVGVNTIVGGLLIVAGVAVVMRGPGTSFRRTPALARPR
jgi:drug/metabolite transporter (DMT)-like permease